MSIQSEINRIKGNVNTTLNTIAETGVSVGSGSDALPAAAAALANQKQDKLTFDATPTAGSTNPVTSGGVKTALDLKAGKSSAVTATLSASGWSSGSYTLSVSGVTTTSNQEVLPGLSITAAQLEALQAANIQDGGQSSGKIILKAYGDVPTINIPIRVIVRGD